MPSSVVDSIESNQDSKKVEELPDVGCCHTLQYVCAASKRLVLHQADGKQRIVSLRPGSMLKRRLHARTLGMDLLSLATKS